MKYNYTGTGVKYPLTISKGSTTLFEGGALLSESLRRILLTQRGRTFFNPDFGSDLHKLKFEPNDEIFEDIAELFIKQAIAKWEKRVKVEGVGFSHDDSTVNIEVSYRILNTSQVEGFVFPFYRQLI